jgi:hypothetical protein
MSSVARAVLSTRQPESSILRTTDADTNDVARIAAPRCRRRVKTDP